MDTVVKGMVTTFVAALERLIAERMNARLRSVLAVGLVAAPEAERAEIRRPAPAKVVRAARRKGPIQLCPMPGCKERAAPIFGMVCKKHRAVPKAIVRNHREARRARKAS